MDAHLCARVKLGSVTIEPSLAAVKLWSVNFAFFRCVKGGKGWVHKVYPPWWEHVSVYRALFYRALFIRALYLLQSSAKQSFAGLCRVPQCRALPRRIDVTFGQSAAARQGSFYSHDEFRADFQSQGFGQDLPQSLVDAYIYIYRKFNLAPTWSQNVTKNGTQNGVKMEPQRCQNGPR